MAVINYIVMHMDNTGRHEPQIRSFIAIELSAELKQYLGNVQEKLKRSGCTGVKWVLAESIHLTLKFLGNIAENKVPQITEAIGRACVGQSSMGLSIGTLGVFPGLKRPRVLWIAVNGEVDKLVRLQQCIDRELKPLGFEQEKRPFSPHLTLARARDRITTDEQARMGRLVAENVTEESIEVNVEKVSLMKSRLLPGGAVYTQLATVDLKGQT